jgi:hypothetical protein
MTGKTQTFEWFSMLNRAMTSAKDAVHLLNCFFNSWVSEVHPAGTNCGSLNY